MRRGLIRTAAGLGAALVLAATAACAPGGAGGEAEQTGDQTLTYLYFTDGPDEQATRDLIARFEQETGATVNLELIPYANLEQTLQAWLSGGNPPDVARLTTLTPVRDDLVDLTALRPELAGQYLDGMAGPATGPGGELLAVPSDLTLNGPMINLDLFEKAGVEPPTAQRPWRSWDEVVEAAEQVKKGAGTEFGLAMDVSGHRFSTMMSQYGTTVFDESGTQVALAEEPAVAAVTRFAELNADGVMPRDLWLQAGTRYTAANEIFLAQQAPIYVSGNWQVAAFAESAEFDWAAVPNPCQERCGGFPGGKFMGAFKASPRQQLAADFIAFMNSADSQRYLADKANFLPTRKDLIESGVEYSNRDADMQVFLADVQQTPPDTFGTSFSPAFSATSTEMTKVLAAVLAGQQDPAQAVAAFRKGAEKSLQDAAG